MKMLHQWIATARPARLSRHWAAMLLCAALSLPGLSASTKAKEKFTVFDVESSDTIAYSINDMGMIVGTDGYRNGFVRAPDGTVTIFAPANNFITYPVSINGAESIAGWYEDQQINIHGFVRASDGTITTIDFPGSLDTRALSINAAGAATGRYMISGATSFVRAADGTITTFGNYETYAQAINDKGAVTGDVLDFAGASHGFLRSARAHVTMFDPSGAGTGYDQGTHPMAINSLGAIAGWYIDSNYKKHGFVRNADGTITSFDAEQSRATYPQSINPKGKVVGYYRDHTRIYHGFVRDGDGTIRSIDPPGSIFTEAYGINGTGSIVGYFEDRKHRLHGFLRSP